jgi:hypothetical protein
MLPLRNVFTDATDCIEVIEAIDFTEPLLEPL